ncbi:hypothetical protein [Nocardia rhamnosiphila]|uniref:Uncharacterized protein n=1 Tax=Nocardia rhamnosiphila TaxID=426716 RepID=A0ABV2WWJ5_9NOCA
MTVTTGGGGRLTENLTRDLFARLVTSGVTAEHGSGSPDPAEGHKGALSPDLVLLVTVATTATAKVLTTLISEWCAVDRNRAVTVTRRSGTLEVTGGGENARLALEHFFADSTEPASADSADQPTDPGPDTPSEHPDPPR